MKRDKRAVEGLVAPVEVSVHASCVVPEAVTSREGLHRAALDLIRSIPPTEKGIRLVGVTVSNFIEAPAPMAGELPIFVEAAA